MKKIAFALFMAWLIASPTFAQQPDLLSLIGSVKTLAGGPLSSDIREVLLGVRANLGYANKSGRFQCDAGNIAMANEKIGAASKMDVQSAAGEYHWIVDLYTDCALTKGFKSPWVEGDQLVFAMLAFRPRAPRYMFAESDGIKMPPFELATIKKIADYAGSSNELKQEIDRQIAAEERARVEQEQAEEKRRDEIESAKRSPASRIGELDGLCIDQICLGQPLVLYASQLDRASFDKLNNEFPMCESKTWSSQLKGANGKAVDVTWYSWEASEKGLHVRIGKISSTARGQFVKAQARAVFEEKLVGGLKEVKRTVQAMPQKPVPPPPLSKSLKLKVEEKMKAMTDRQMSDYFLGGRVGRLPTPVESALSESERRDYYAWSAADRKYHEALAKYRSAQFFYSGTGDDDSRFMARRSAIPGHPEIGEVTLAVSYSPAAIEVTYEVARSENAVELKAQPACIKMAREATAAKLKGTPKF